ncbi:MAG: sugar phosphate isomerase/epimerase [Acidobacteria bacterium]|nr:sugar phosphate isomerase/epimerase [Acidobacteriota bacterium]
MDYTRREFGKLALAGVPTTWLFERSRVGSAFAAERPNSVINGVRIGTITYSYRSMPDQSAEATLRYIVDSGISAIELMNGPAESFAGSPAPQRGGGGGGRRGQPPTPEQQAEQRARADALRKWRLSVSMDRYKALRKMYNDAGVTIYAWKCLNPAMSDEEFEYVFNVAEALGCTHTTLELTDKVEQLKRIGAFAEKRKIYAAYHTHTQGTMTAFDQAFAVSRANMANVDFGHYVAAGNVGGTAVQFLQKHHDRIASFHMKDRTTPENGAKNLPWGTGDTPLTEILQTLKKNRWRIPATIELEYAVPEGSDAVKEVATCLQYCREALA